MNADLIFELHNFSLISQDPSTRPPTLTLASMSAISQVTHTQAEGVVDAGQLHDMLELAATVADRLRDVLKEAM